MRLWVINEVIDMKTTTDYTFEVSISEKAYDHKPDKKTEVPLIRFAKKTVDINGFLEHILEGYCYAPIFANNHRHGNNYLYSYIVSIDVDHSLEPMNEMVDRLEYKPTCAYTSCNNGLNGESRFRLVYCFEDRIEKKDEYKELVYAIFNANHLDINEKVNDDFKYDPQSKVPSQLYFGNGTDTFEFTVTDIIYSKIDFDIYYNINNSIDNNILYSNSNKSINENHTYTPTNNIHLNDTFDDEQFENDYWNMRMENILSKYIYVFPNMEHTPLPEVDDDTPYIIYPSGYIEIRRWWRKRLDGKPIKIKDGEGRRRKLFMNGIIRRLINPNITFDNLLYNLLYELVNYISNYEADNIIDKKELFKIARDVMSKDMANYEHLRGKHKQFIVNPNYCIKHNLTKNEVKSIAAKVIRHQKIGELYDCSKTIKENVEIMKANGLERISEPTLKRWMKENGITKYKKKVK